ncbi:MAG: GGDEF domain-containing protein [Gammaproteobacteria bacterium]|nr:GGDEF domain-containing protein [Gammaproteobacteria bacterium]
MLNNLSLKKLSIIILFILLLMGAIFAYVAQHLSEQVTEINSSWLSFRAQHAEKARLLNSLNGGLGYGGMIHNFKNYILRKDFNHYVKLERSLGAAQSIVKQYYALSTLPAEKIALNDIRAMLNNYQTALELIQTEISKGSTSREIDNLARIDDTLALRGLRVLHSEIIQEHVYFNDKKQKPVLAAYLRSELGYGGMIHSFKNYLLRHNDTYRESALDSISNIENIIADYYQLEPSTAEKTALEDLLSAVKNYKNNLKLIKEGINNKHSSETIDNTVKVDDYYALRGLTTLDHVIIMQINEKSRNLSEMLLSINNSVWLNAATAITLIIILAMFIFWIFSKKIIDPVMNISKEMSELAAGNLDYDLVQHTTSKDNTELGVMDTSLQVFKENEIKRRAAEEELRKLAMTDPLTGLANRNYFEKRFYETTSLARREEKLIALLAIDLDKFKPINDEYGHAAGDEVLKAVAHNLTLLFRETDIIARLGGDEFAVLLYAPENLDNIEKVVHRLIESISTPVYFGKDPLSVSVSIGIALQSHAEDIDLDSLMRNADEALYQAKDGGRNTYRVYGKDISASSNS